MRRRSSKKELEKSLIEFTESLTGEADETEKVDFLSAGSDDTSSLFDTVRTISSVLQTKQPSENFSARLSQAVRLRYIIDRAVAARDFREKFFEDKVAACHDIKIDLTPREMAILQDLEEDALEEFAKNLGKEVPGTI